MIEDAPTQEFPTVKKLSRTISHMPPWEKTYYQRVICPHPFVKRSMFFKRRQCVVCGVKGRYLYL